MASILNSVTKFFNLNGLGWTEINDAHYLSCKAGRGGMHPISIRRLIQKESICGSLSFVVSVFEPDERASVNAAALLAFAPHDAIFTFDEKPVLLDGLPEIIKAFCESGIDYINLPSLKAMEGQMKSASDVFNAKATQILRGRADADGESWKYE